MRVFGRFSALRSDEGFMRYVLNGAESSEWRITVDGKEVQQAVTADTRKGEVLANELNDDGQAFVRDGEVARQTLRGRVRVYVTDKES